MKASIKELTGLCRLFFVRSFCHLVSSPSGDPDKLYCRVLLGIAVTHPSARLGCVTLTLTYPTDHQVYLLRTDINSQKQCYGFNRQKPCKFWD